MLALKRLNIEIDGEEINNKAEKDSYRVKYICTHYTIVSVHFCCYPT